MSNINLYNQLRSSGQLVRRPLCGQSTCLAKTFILDIACKPFNKMFFIHATFIATIDIYHLLPLSVTLILAGCHTVSTKQNLLASFSHAVLKRMGWNLIWRWSNSSWTPWNHFWISVFRSREITVFCWLHQTTLMLAHIWTFYDPIWFKLGMVIDDTKL